MVDETGNSDIGHLRRVRENQMGDTISNVF